MTRISKRSALPPDLKAKLLAAQAATRDRVFRRLLDEAGLPAPEAEVRFHPVRRHRLDYAWPAARLGLEVEGGVWTRGRHGRGSGIVKDMEKHNLLACAGWRLLRVTPDELTRPDTVALIRAALDVSVVNT